MKTMTENIRKAVAMFLMLLSICSVLTMIAGSSAYACSECPNSSALDAVGDDIKYPKQKSYLREYEYKVVHAPHAEAVYFYWAPKADQDHRRPFNILENTTVTVLARENGLSCVITEDKRGRIVSGWITTTNLYDFCDDSYIEMQERVRREDEAKKAANNAANNASVITAPTKDFTSSVFYAHFLSCRESGDGWDIEVNRVTWDWLPDSLVCNFEVGSKVNIRGRIYTVERIKTDSIVFIGGSSMIPTSIDPENLDKTGSKGWLLLNEGGNVIEYEVGRISLHLPASASMINNMTFEHINVNHPDDLSSYSNSGFEVLVKHTQGAVYYIEGVYTP